MNFFTPLGMRALVARRSRVRIKPARWGELVAELGRRGAGVRESGAFLLAPSTGRLRRTVQRIVYFDDLDPDCLRGDIAIGSSAFDALWAICSAAGMRVIADVHTHPSTLVGQSDIDRRNPMVATAGHVAVIVPEFAARTVTPAECGVHTYRGAHAWDAAVQADAARVLYIGRWA